MPEVEEHKIIGRDEGEVFPGDTVTLAPRNAGQPGFSYESFFKHGVDVGVPFKVLAVIPGYSKQVIKIDCDSPTTMFWAHDFEIVEEVE